MTDVLDLHYFPMMAADWLSGVATMQMTPEQRGAFIDLLCVSWMAKDVPCSLPNDDKVLAQLSRLGRRWKTVGGTVKSQFKPVPGHPNHIRNGKLWKVYLQSVEKHKKRVDAGRRGGMKAAEQRLSNASGSASGIATPELVANGKQSESESESEPKSVTTTTLSLSAEPKIAKRERHAPDWPLAVIGFVSEQENPGAWMSAFVAMLKGMGAPGGKAVTVDHIEQGCIEIKQLGGEITPRRFRRVLEQITEPKGGKLGSADDAEFVKASKRLQEIASYRDPVRSQSLSADGWKIVTPQEREALKNIGTVERVLTAKPDQWAFVVRDFVKAQRGAAQ